MVSFENWGVVIIGRNEGERLKVCLNSTQGAPCVIYVDSGSTDGSSEIARTAGAVVVDLDMAIPFTAARARNAGLQRLLSLEMNFKYVQFIDGDCELNPIWPANAVCFLSSHKDVAIVFGRRRERYPDQTVYNWLCDVEWNVQLGEVKSCGGDAFVRITALLEVGGYRGDLIAGEEPELCVRLRANGWRVWRIDSEMTLHDAALLHFSQWFKRTVRNGYAFAEGSYLHGKTPEQHWVKETRRGLIWGLVLPFLCVCLTVVWFPLGALSMFIFPLQLVRLAIRNKGHMHDRITLAFFQLIGKFAETVGQLRFYRNRLLKKDARLIEYK